jgi:hypothetical protein
LLIINKRKFYYQGSYQTTDDGIEKAFKKANNQNDKTRSVLFFDEIGMAELNPENPLKVLHKLLDQNVYSKESKKEEFKKDESNKPRIFDKNNFSLVSISNWKLDLSKMSRSIYITRPDLLKEDLEITSKDLMTNMYKKKSSKNEEETNEDKHYNKFTENVKEISELVSEVYAFMRKNKMEEKSDKRIFEHQNFHCLRDFYWLCKHIGSKISNFIDTDEKLYKMIVEYIDIDFSGYIGKMIQEKDDDSSYQSDSDEEDKNENAEKKEELIKKTRSNEIFKNKLIEKSKKENHIIEDYIKKQVKIKDSLEMSILEPNNRFLMLFVQNEFCKGQIQKIIKNILDKGFTKKDQEKYKKIIYLRGSKLNFDNNSVIYIRNYLKKIKYYAQLGFTIFMEDLDSIYPILYDLFNQNYLVKEDGKKYGKMTYHDQEEWFKIHKKFRIIIIKYKNEIDVEERIMQRLPSPLLNRMEKHIIEYKDLKDDTWLLYTNTENKLKQIAKKFNDKFKVNHIDCNDLIYCYNNGELLQSLILKIKSGYKDDDKLDERIEKLESELIRFYSYKMLVLHCLYQHEDKKFIKQIKKEFRDTHQFRNLKAFIQEPQEKAKKTEKSTEVSKHNHKMVSKSVVLTLTSYFNIDFSQFKG